MNGAVARTTGPSRQSPPLLSLAHTGGRRLKAFGSFTTTCTSDFTIRNVFAPDAHHEVSGAVTGLLATVRRISRSGLAAASSTVSYVDVTIQFAYTHNFPPRPVALISSNIRERGATGGASRAPPRPFGRLDGTITLHLYIVCDLCSRTYSHSALLSQVTIVPSFTSVDFAIVSVLLYIPFHFFSLLVETILYVHTDVTQIHSSLAIREDPDFVSRL